MCLGALGLHYGFGSYDDLAVLEDAKSYGESDWQAKVTRAFFLQETCYSASPVQTMLALSALAGGA